MLIDTLIIFKDESKSDILGKDIHHKSKMTLDLAHVSAIMPGDENKEKTIVFLHGNDLLLDEPYDNFHRIWVKAKQESFQDLLEALGQPL
jgi:hypothetical protein